MREREVKLAASNGFVPPDLSDLSVLGDLRRLAGPVTVYHVDHYFDSADLRLARWGCTLRHRVGETWTVKLPSTGTGPMLDREEVDYPEAQEPDAEHDPPAEALRLINSLLREAPVEQQATLRTCRTRQEWRDASGALVFEVDDDKVDASIDGGREASFHQIEVQLAPTADEALLDPVVERLLAAGAWYDQAVPKLVRAMGDLPPPDVTEPALGPEPTAREVIGSALARSVGHLLVHLPVARHGVDPEGIHQARVATRRLRSDLRTFGPLLDRTWAKNLQNELRWLARELGKVRDADVLLARFASTLAAHPEIDPAAASTVVADLETERDADRQQLLADLDDDRTAQLLGHLVAAAADPMTAPQADDPATERLGNLVRKRWRRLERTVDALGPEPPFEQLHEVRILAKRARYAAQAVAPAYPDDATRFAKAIAAVQDVLGELNDAEVAISWLQSASPRLDTDAVFAAGQMAQVLHTEGTDMLSEWEDAYRRAARRKLRAWFSR